MNLRKTSGLNDAFLRNLEAHKFVQQGCFYACRLYEIRCIQYLLKLLTSSADGGVSAGVGMVSGFLSSVSISSLMVTKKGKFLLFQKPTGRGLQHSNCSIHFLYRTIRIHIAENSANVVKIAAEMGTLMTLMTCWQLIVL